jgi:hypothetical protein
MRELEKMKKTKQELMQMVYGSNWVEQDLLKQNAKLREALLRVRTWGLASKNWSATHGDDMAQWIDAGCVGELPPPRSEWICGKLEGAK